VGQQQDGVASVAALVVREAAADDRRHPECRQHVRRDRGTLDARRFPAVVDRMSLGDVRGDLREAAQPLAQRQELASGSDTAGEAHQLVRSRVRERAEHDRVHDGEDRRVRADPERQRQRRRNGEGRSTAQGAPSKAEVLCEIGHEFPPPLRLLLPSVVLDERVAHRRGVSELLQRFPARLVIGHAERDVAFDAHVDVEAQLIVDVRRDVRAGESEVSPPARNVAHASAGAARRTRVTACE
jgi:hypothetical protein